jgi:hypothetical protein
MPEYHICVNHSAMNDTQDAEVILQSVIHKDGVSIYEP